MNFLVLLSVLAITQTIVSARPADINLKTKRSPIDEPSIVFKPSSIQFPTELQNGFTVTINGTLDTKSEAFEVVFPSRNRTDNEQCRIKYHFEDSILDMLPEHPHWETETYKLFTHEEHPTFSIRLKAWSMDEEHSFIMLFEGNNGGDSSAMTCNLTRFDDFERIEFKNGLHSITSFFVEFL